MGNPITDIEPQLKIVKMPVITEKAMKPAGPRQKDRSGRATGEARQQFVFWVDRNATKTQIKHAVEKIFSVHVESVRTAVFKGHWRRARWVYLKSAPRKKAWVTLREGEAIDLMG